MLSLAGSFPWEQPLHTYLWDEARLGHAGGWCCLPMHLTGDLGRQQSARWLREAEQRVAAPSCPREVERQQYSDTAGCGEVEERGAC